MRSEIDDPGVPASVMNPVCSPFQTGEDEGDFPTLDSMDWSYLAGGRFFAGTTGAWRIPVRMRARCVPAWPTAPPSARKFVVQSPLVSHLTKRQRCDEAPTLSLFERALEQEQEGALGSGPLEGWPGGIASAAVSPAPV